MARTITTVLLVSAPAHRKIAQELRRQGLVCFVAETKTALDDHIRKLSSQGHAVQTLVVVLNHALTCTRDDFPGFATVWWLSGLSTVATIEIGTGPPSS